MKRRPIWHDLATRRKECGRRWGGFIFLTPRHKLQPVTLEPHAWRWGVCLLYGLKGRMEALDSGALEWVWH